MKEVGAYEAKTTLPALLRAVAKGERVVITKSGKPVADLVPHRTGAKDPGSAISQIRQMRRGISLGEGTVREMIEEGRR